MDNTANPYIALSALVAAGMLGLLRVSSLPRPLQVAPASLGAAQLELMGVRRLPATLEAALAELEQGGGQVGEHGALIACCLRAAATHSGGGACVGCCSQVAPSPGHCLLEGCGPLSTDSHLRAPQEGMDELNELKAMLSTLLGPRLVS